MGVGGVQSGLATIGAGPFRLRSDQARARARTVEMHLVARGEEIANIAVAEVVRGAQRAVVYADRPFVRQGRPRAGEAGAGGRLRHRIDLQDVAGARRAGGMAAEPAETEIRALPEEERGL